jgi:uncharacterized membrane protein
MLIDAPLLAPGWRLATTLVALPALVWALVTAPWSTWLDRSDRQHLWLGTLVLLVLIWSMRAGVTPGLSFQFLLVAALTLMHGARLALVGVAVVLAAECLQAGGAAPWTAWGANLVCYGLLPVAFVTALHRVVQRTLPRNYFVYFFVTVFAGSMLAFNLAGAARLGLLAASGTLVEAKVAGEYLVFLPMMSFAEAFVNGIVMAMAVVYRPDWVASFDDAVYLRR